MKRILFLLILLFPSFVCAESLPIDSCNITVNGKSYRQLEDNSFKTVIGFSSDEKINISCDEDISYIYINYDIRVTKGEATTENGSYSLGINGYLHELVRLDKGAKEITLSYSDNYMLSDIYLFSKEIPSWVQDWKTLKEADMMLFSTHSDDEQLFFAGLLPTYVDRGKKIQVIYYTNHYNDTSRYHELLNGLWVLGIKYYPEMSVFPDEYSESLDEAIGHLDKNGFSVDDAIRYQVDMIRKYKPKVVVGHDEDGEYGHGQHMLNTYTLKNAIKYAADKNYDSKLEPYQIDKLYLHLYGENPIVMNYDIPLESFGGKTAFEIAKLGYAEHYSQQYTWFTGWLNGKNNEYTKMTDITEYSPCNFGLYFTNVGPDKNKDDMYENVKDRILEDKKDSNEKVKSKAVDQKKIDWVSIGIGLGLMTFSSISLMIILLVKKIKNNKRKK